MRRRWDALLAWCLLAFLASARAQDDADDDSTTKVTSRYTPEHPNYGPAYIIIGINVGVIVLFYLLIVYMYSKRQDVLRAERQPEPLSDNVPPASDAREGEPIEYTDYYSPGFFTMVFTITWIVLFALAALPLDTPVWPYGFIPLSLCLIIYFVLGYRVVKFDNKEGVFTYRNVRCWRLCHFAPSTIKMSRLRGVNLKAHTYIDGVVTYIASIERMRPHEGTPLLLPLGKTAGDLGRFDIALAKRINKMISKFNGGYTVDLPQEGGASRTNAAANSTPAFCPYCGHKVRDREAQFCGKCGKRISGGDGASTSGGGNKKKQKKEPKSADKTSRKSGSGSSSSASGSGSKSSESDRPPDYSEFAKGKGEV